ncbi:stage V sporulation protein AC [Firmicutes bacterium CAG:460]|nr:SpoVA/SpoVAEb family sporulation membrane protein [Bacillota bacterium]CDE50599.1 stage V sporulation protein AC [Firmicutes bacterium CAG:460]
MNKEDYKKLVKKHTPKEPKLRNVGVAFLVGGLIGLFAEILIFVIKHCFSVSVVVAGLITALIVIFLSSLFTALGFFDNWVNKCKCGLIIPTTGFAHSVASSALEYKKDGLITGLGSNFFKLAGSVILYGIISAFILVIVKVIFGG